MMLMACHEKSNNGLAKDATSGNAAASTEQITDSNESSVNDEAPIVLTDKMLNDGWDHECYEEAGPNSVHAFKEMPQLEHPELGQWVEQYNAWALTYDMISLAEKWSRLAGEDSDKEKRMAILDSIKAFRIEGLIAPEAKATILNLQKSLQKNITAIEWGNTEISYWPKETADKNGSTLNATLIEIMPDNQETGTEKVYETLLGWHQLLTSERWKAVTATEKGCEERFIKLLQSASTFDEQCQWALCGAKEFESDKAMAVMRALLRSGHYGEHLFALWFGWRTLTQIHYYGRSRDSVIADALYNEYRHMAFLTTLRYVDQHMDDNHALWQLTYLCEQDNINRNGSSLLGNDANIEYEIVFGEDME